MEYHLTKKTVTGMRYLLDTAVEQAVDADLTLPDYCPDIERILSCTLRPQIYLSNINGDRLNVEGGSCVRIMYLDGERGCMRTYEYTVPFSQSLPLKDAPADCAVFADASPEYINCRALSPRKLSLHGAFSLCVKVAVPNELSYCGCEDGGDLQVKSESLAASELCGLCSESFSVQEDIPVNGNSGISTILTHRLCARITELKAIRGKIMLSAELKLELMYLSGVDQPQVQCMSYSLPVSRVIDCEGASESAVIDGELKVQSDDLHLSDDALDGSALLSLDARLCFSALCYEQKEIEVLTDAFSTEREVELQTGSFSCCGDVTCRSCTDVAKTAVGVEEEIGKVIDVHCEKLSVSPTAANGALTLNTKLCVGILYENSEGETRYVERDASVIYAPDTEGCEELLRLGVSADSLSYRLTDGRHMELRTELCYRLTLCCRRSCTNVTAVAADDDAPAREKDGSVILYYTDDGESVWDIGKRFCSRPEEIIAENGIEGDSVPSGAMLLIPTA